MIIDDNKDGEKGMEIIVIGIMTGAVAAGIMPLQSVIVRFI
jgi:hypothetical protein